MEQFQHSITEEEFQSAEQIIARYQEICDALTITPPKFLIKAEDEMPKNSGLYVRHSDGTCSIFLSDQIRAVGSVNAIIIHELSHHALFLAGYGGSGHAWVMLATEQILFKKAGLKFNSIMWDAQNNWPKHIFWRIWLNHVLHAFEVVDQPVVESEILSKPGVAIAAWVLQQHAPFEGKFGRHWFLKKPLEMYHTIISDLRSFRILAKWTTRALLLGGFAIFAIADRIGLVWLKDTAAFVLIGTLIVVMFVIGLADVCNKTVTLVKSLWHKASKVKTLFNTN